MNAPGDLLVRARAAITRWHPRGRRWLRFLAEHDLDPDCLERPVEVPGVNDFVICGAPRSGTTLLAAMLFQPPQVVTVVEPWLGMKLAPGALFRCLRTQIDNTGRVSSGRLDIEGLQNSGEVIRTAERGSSPVQVKSTYLLGVKWPAFWRYIELLPDTRFLVCVRHPYDVIASFRAQGGRLRLGLEFDLRFHRKMNDYLLQATWQPAIRRVLLYDYIYERVVAHMARSNVLMVHFERWYTDSDAQRREIGRFLKLEIGQGPATLKGSAAIRRISERDRRLVDRVCCTAERLGYALGVSNGDRANSVDRGSAT